MKSLRPLSLALLGLWVLSPASAWADMINYNQTFQYHCQPGEAQPPEYSLELKVVFNCKNQANATLNYAPQRTYEILRAVKDSANQFSSITNTSLHLKQVDLIPTWLMLDNSTLTFEQSRFTINHADVYFNNNVQFVFSHSIFVQGTEGHPRAIDEHSPAHVSVTLENNSILTMTGLGGVVGGAGLESTFHFKGENTINFEQLMRESGTGNTKIPYFVPQLAQALNEDIHLNLSYVTLKMQEYVTPFKSLSLQKWAILYTHVLPEHTVLGDEDQHLAAERTALVYSGNQKDAVEKIELFDAPAPKTASDLLLRPQLRLISNLGSVDLSKLGGKNNILMPMNNETLYTGFSNTNFTVIASLPADEGFKQQISHINYNGHSVDWMPLTGLYSPDAATRPSLQLNEPLPPMDLSTLKTDVFETYVYTLVKPKSDYQAHGKIILNADQTITKLSDAYSIEVLPGKTLTWTQPTTTPLVRNVIDGNPVLTGSGGILMLTAPKVHWNAQAFTKLDAKQMVVAFGTQGTTANTHTVDALPANLGVAKNTTLVYDGSTLPNNQAPIHAAFIEGNVQLSNAVDFNHTTPFPHVWHVQQGSGSIVLNTAHFTHPEGWFGHSDILIAVGPQSLKARLEGASKVTVGGKEYAYQMVQRAVSSTSPTSRSTSAALLANLHGAQYGWFLRVTTPGMAVPTPVVTPKPSKLLSLGQPAVEGQIRFDLNRLNRNLWHSERTTRYGLNTWVKAVGTFQMRDTVDMEAAHYGRRARAGGINLGAEYRLPVDRHQSLALSLVTEWLSGVREVGDVSFDEQRWNTGVGARLQKDDIYGAFSTQWSQVWHSLDANNTQEGLSHSQYAFAINAEVGKTLHMTPVVDLTPFAQYNWTIFDKTYASSEAEKAQQHLQLGAYLNMPWVSPEGVTVRNRLGLATVLSIFSNDSASFQASWKLRLSGERLGSHLGIQLETTAEYAPADNRMGLDLTLGADYAF